MKRLLFVIALLVALAGIAWPVDRSVQAGPALDELLSITGQLTYDVRPDNGPVTVTWEVDLKNNDPETVLRDFGRIFFYEGVSLPVLRGASNIRVVGPGGGSLGFSLDDPGQGPIAFADINFDRNLYFGQTYSFTLSYQLTEARSDFILITPFYVYLPAIVLGDSTDVFIMTPEGSAWDVSLDPGDCSESGAGAYQCGASEFLQVAAVVEVSRPDALLTTESTVPMSTSELSLTIQYFPGEEAWATHVQEIASVALPILEDLFGFRYPGPNEFEITESGRQQLAGYEGIFDCLGIDCVIGISPIGDDLTTVHELAHFWTTLFDERWIQEGLAEFMARRANDHPSLAMLVSARAREPVDFIADFQLDVWGPPPFFIDASDEQRDREYTGYEKSLRFMEVLEQTVGLQALQAANAAAFEYTERIGPGYLVMTSREYFDLLEDASGTNLDKAFAQWVFLPHVAAMLPDRRDSRDRLEALGEDVEDAGLTLDLQIEELVRDWQFERADSFMDKAESALRTYQTAEETLEESRSLWEKFGLLYRDPDRTLANAAASFNNGDYSVAIEQAEAAKEMIEDSGRLALYRLLVAMVMFVIVVGGGIFLFLRRPRRSGYLSS